jgi:hypothetical protein
MRQDIGLILLVIAVLMAILGSWLRGNKDQQKPRPKVLRGDNLPPWEEAPPKPRRRAPPPLPVKRARRVEPVPTVLPVAQPVTLPAQAPPAAAALLKEDVRPRAAAMVQLAAFLKHPKTLRAAVLLNEVLGPPKSRQMTQRAHQPKDHAR